MSLHKIYFSLLAIALLAFGCGESNEPPKAGPPKVNVTLHKVQAALNPYFEDYAGVVKALKEVEIRPQVGGYITGIYFEEGEKVFAGQKLYSIDRQPFQAAYEQASANLEVQKASLERARKDLARYQELDKKDAIAKQQLDYAEAAYNAALQQVEAAKATATNVQTNVKYATITAPFEGTIGISLVRLGASVSPGQTLLNTISTDNPMAIEVAIDQSEIDRFAKLKSTAGSEADSTFQLMLNGKVYPHLGALSFIDRAVDPMTGTIKVRVEFPNPDFSLRAGMSASLRVRSNADSKSISIPFKAVTEQLGEFFVYVSEEGKVSQRKVRLGQQVGNNIIVEAGLEAGETIAVEGVQNLREGSLINVPDASAPEK